MKKRTLKEFIELASKAHHNKYDYSLFEYVNNQTKGIIICPLHGKFLQTPANHLKNRGCSLCGITRAAKTRKSNIDEFIIKAKQIHKDKYDYSKFVYFNARKKGIIICLEHGEFKQTPYSHLSGSGCPKCCYNFKMTLAEFIKRASKIHGQYDYSKVLLINTNTKVIIICKKHGKFKQIPEHHLRGYGCE